MSKESDILISKVGGVVYTLLGMAMGDGPVYVSSRWGLHTRF